MPAITRRDLLRRAGTTVAGGVLAALVPGIAGAHEGEQAEPHREGAGETTEATGQRRIRRWVMVIDLRACDGCTGIGLPPQCTQYCNWGRYVPEGQQWIEVYEVSHEEAAAHHFPEAPRSFLAAPCMQCQNAPCVNVCPVGATFHTPEGMVLIDQERCIGCRLCMAACPYDRRFFNWGEPEQPAFVRNLPYDIRTQVPAIRGTVMKCDFCTEQLAAGGLPFCVEGCPNGAIYVGDLEEGIATNGDRMVRLADLLNQDGVSRYREELGTEPRVYYIHGHGEAASDEEERGPFRKDRLEWPWRTVNAELERAGVAALGAAPSAG